MSPSPNNLAKRINRDLTQGDVLLHPLDNNGITKAYEVVSPHFAGKRRKILGLLGMKVEIDCVRVRELTQHGPVERTNVYSRDENVWTDIIRAENRTDRPLRER